MKDPWETDDNPVEEAPSVMVQTNIKTDAVPAGASASPDPPVALRQPPKTENPNAAQPVNGLPPFCRENLLQGIIWAEILGKPLSKRGRG